MLLAAGMTVTVAGTASAVLPPPVGGPPPPPVTVTPCAGRHATGPFKVVDHTQVVDSSGKSFVPYGPTVSADLDGMSFTEPAPGTETMDEQEMDWAANDWCSNIVRIQINQDLLFNNPSRPSLSNINTDVLTAIRDEVSHAINDKLVVVLNDSTESSNNRATEKGPTQTTRLFWLEMAKLYGKGNGPKYVIFDLFNEPREGTSKPPTAAEWKAWYSGSGKNYIGMQQLASTVRHSAGNLLWIEGPSYSDSLAMLANATYRIKRVSGIVYAIHHPLKQSTANTPPSGCKAYPNPHNYPDNECVWNYDFGFLVKDHIAPVVVGEWTNRELNANEGGLDACWTDAGTQVPAFLSYLAGNGIGLSVYSFIGGYMLRQQPDGTNLNPLQPTQITSAWTCDPGWLNVYQGTEGAGHAVYNFFKKENSLTSS